MAEQGRFMEALVGEGHGDPEHGAHMPHADAVAIATAAGLEQARFDPALSTSLRGFLDLQARYVALQSEHLHEQRELLLSRLRLHRFGDRVRVVTQICLMTCVALLVAGLIALVAGAAASRSVIIAPFDVPPELAASGFTGKVVANGLLDALVRSQDAREAALRRHLTGAWAHRISIEVPETGISIADLDEALRGWLGHDLELDGDVTRTPAGGIALTVRADGIPPRSFTGTLADLASLDAAAAEYVLGQAESHG